MNIEDDDDIKPTEAILMLLEKNKKFTIYRRELVDKLDANIEYGFSRKQIQDSLTRLIKTGRVKQVKVNGLNAIRVVDRDAIGKPMDIGKYEQILQSLKEEEAKQKIPIMPCNLWNEALGGGIQRGSMVGVAYPSDHGKTSLAITIAITAACRGYRTLFLSTAGEENNKKLIGKACSFLYGRITNEGHPKLKEIIESGRLILPRNMKSPTAIDSILYEVGYHNAEVIIVDYISPSTIQCHTDQTALVTEAGRQLLEIISTQVKDAQGDMQAPVVINFLQLKKKPWTGGAVVVEGEGQGQWINPYQHVFHWLDSQDVTPQIVANRCRVEKGKREGFGKMEKYTFFRYSICKDTLRIKSFGIEDFRDEKELKEDDNTQWKRIEQRRLGENIS